MSRQGYLFHQSRPGLVPNANRIFGNGGASPRLESLWSPNESSSSPLYQHPIENVPSFWILQFLVSICHRRDNWFVYLRLLFGTQGILIVCVCAWPYHIITLMMRFCLSFHGVLKLVHLTHFASKVVESGSNPGDVTFFIRLLDGKIRWWFMLLLTTFNYTIFLLFEMPSISTGHSLVWYCSLRN